MRLFPSARPPMQLTMSWARRCHPPGPDHRPASRPCPAPSPARTSNCCTRTGSARPSWLTPSPEPACQPILARSLLPTLASAAATGVTGPGLAAGAEAEEPAARRGSWTGLRSKAGRSGWWCTSRRSAARSRYCKFVPVWEASALFLRRLPASRIAASARLVCIHKGVDNGEVHLRGRRGYDTVLE